MDELKRLGMQLSEEKNPQHLINKLYEFNMIQNDKQCQNIINKDMKVYSDDLYSAEKAIRNVLKQRKSDDEEKQFYLTLGESMGVIKFLKCLYNNIRYKQIFEHSIEKLLKYDDFRNLINIIYKYPNINQNELQKKLNLNREQIETNIDKLISNKIIVQYGGENDSNYELSPLMVEFYKKNLKQCNNTVSRINAWSKATKIESDDIIANMYSELNYIEVKEVARYGKNKINDRPVRSKTKKLVYSKI